MSLSDKVEPEKAENYKQCPRQLGQSECNGSQPHRMLPERLNCILYTAQPSKCKMGPWKWSDPLAPEIRGTMSDPQLQGSALAQAPFHVVNLPH